MATTYLIDSPCGWGPCRFEEETIPIEGQNWPIGVIVCRDHDVEVGEVVDGYRAVRIPQHLRSQEN